MAKPTVEQIRTWSKVPFAEKGYAKPESGEDPLTILVERAYEYVEDTTGRDLEDPPSKLKLTLEEAVQRTVEWSVYGGGEDAAETAGLFDLVKSFGAGSYNETSRDLGDRNKGKVVHPWPLLNDLLWRAMTEAKKDEWRETWGQIVPAFEVTEVDWSAGDVASGPPFPWE